MRNAALLAGAALFATPAMAQQQPISPLAGGRVMPSQPLATTTGSTAASRMKPGAALETGPMRPAMAGGLLADELAAKNADDKDAKTAKAGVKKKPAAAMGASLLTDDPAATHSAGAKIPDLADSPGDRRPTAVVVRRPPAAAAGAKTKK